MRRNAVIALAALALVAVFAAGCSKDTQEKDAKIKELEQKVAELEEKVRTYDTQITQVKSEAAKLGEEHAVQTRKLEDMLNARQAQTARLASLEITPAAEPDNIWKRVAGKHTYVLPGYPKARNVRFYVKETGAAEKLLGAATHTTAGWSWAGSLPPGDYSLGAEVETTDGTRFFAAVEAIRSGAK